jgi:hypothetical protein
MLDFELLKPEKDQIYKHRNGSVFKIICMAKSANDCTQDIVVYQSISDTDFKSGQIWTTPIVDFSKPNKFKLIESDIMSGKILGI